MKTLDLAMSHFFDFRGVQYRCNADATRIERHTGLDIWRDVQDAILEAIALARLHSDAQRFIQLARAAAFALPINFSGR